MKTVIVCCMLWVMLVLGDAKQRRQNPDTHDHGWRRGEIHTASTNTNTCTHSKLVNDENTRQFHNTCYYFETRNKATNPDAIKFCQRIGGSLANLKSKDINDFMTRELQTSFRMRSGSSDFWIGLNDKNDYVWADGSQMTFNNFYHNKGPKNIFHKNQDCAVISEENGKWKDFVCGYPKPYTLKLRFICEFPGEPGKTIPETPLTTVQSTTKIDNTCHNSNLMSEERSKHFHKTCYYFETKAKKTNSNAKKFCQKIGGSLANLKSKDINDFITRELQTSFRIRSGWNDFWMGLTDEKTEHDYLWSDGSRMTFNNFDQNKGPKNLLHNSQDCAVVNRQNGKWKDFPCGYAHPYELKLLFICEFSGQSKSEPPTVITTILTTPYTQRSRNPQTTPDMSETLSTASPKPITTTTRSTTPPEASTATPEISTVKTSKPPVTITTTKTTLNTPKKITMETTTTPSPTTTTTTAASSTKSQTPTTTTTTTKTSKTITTQDATTIQPSTVASTTAKHIYVPPIIQPTFRVIDVVTFSGDEPQ